MFHMWPQERQNIYKKGGIKSINHKNNNHTRNYNKFHKYLNVTKDFLVTDIIIWKLPKFRILKRNTKIS